MNYRNLFYDRNYVCVIVIIKKNLNVLDLAISLKTHFKLNFSPPFLTKTNGIVLAARKRLVNDRALVYACQWRPDPRRRDARGARAL